MLVKSSTNTFFPRTKESSNFVLVRVSILPPNSKMSGVVAVVVICEGNLQRKQFCLSVRDSTKSLRQIG